MLLALQKGRPLMSTPSPMITLDLLAAHLRAPFPPAEIKFLPKSPVQRGDAWVCLWVPYDPQKRAIALAEEELRQLAERLYRKVGLLPASPAAGLNGATASRPGPGQIQAGPSQGSEQPASAQEFAGAQAAPVLPHKDEERTAASAQGPQASAAASESNGNLYEASAVISPYQRSWIERQLGGDPSRIAKVCQFYQVGTLDELSGLQTVDLVNRLFAQQEEERQRRAPARGERPGQPKASKAVAR